MQTTPGRYLDKGNIFSYINTLKKIVPHNIIIHNYALNGESLTMPGNNQETTETPEATPAVPNLIDIVTRPNRKIHIPKAIELREKGLNNTDIGKHFKCSRQAVAKAIDPYINKINQVTSFKEFRADMLADHQRDILLSITLEDHKKASLLQKVTAMGILYDKERLERDQSTSNIVTLHGDIAALKGHKVG